MVQQGDTWIPHSVRAKCPLSNFGGDRMKQHEFREALETLGLTQTSFAALLATDARTARRYALGEYAVPGPVEMFLRLCLADAKVLQSAQLIAAKRDRRTRTPK